jgi:hypothetical protein
MVIHKYKMTDSSCHITLAPDDIVLSAGLQKDEIYLWVLRRKTTLEEVNRHFYAINTGNTFYHRLTDIFLGTIQTTNGVVWHIFEARD